MADNRLYLACSICKPTQEPKSLSDYAHRVFLGKAFGCDWTRWNKSGADKDLDDFFHRHSHGCIPGDTFELEYEENDPEREKTIANMRAVLHPPH